MAYELVVASKDIQFIPIVMPKNVEVYNLLPEEAMKIRQAQASGQLVVRLDQPDGKKLGVERIWPDPHDPTRMVLFLGPELD